MSIIQTFYDGMATQYDRLFEDWQAATREQAVLLDKLLTERGCHAEWLFPEETGFCPPIVIASK